MSSISARMRFLISYVKIPAEMWDFIIPHGPVYSTAMKEYMMAGIVRDISKEMINTDLAGRVLEAGKAMAGFAAKNLINGWEDGDDICPVWPHFHFPTNPFPEPDPYPWYRGDLAALNPQPLPPQGLASALRVLSTLTSVPEVADQLKEISAKLGRNQF